MSTFNLDTTEADAAIAEFKEALLLPHARKLGVKRLDALDVLSDNIGSLFFSEIDTSTAGTADDPLVGRLKPTQLFVDWLVAMKAGEFDFNVEKVSRAL